MAVGTQDAAAVSVVEEDEFPHYFVLIGSHLLSEKTKGRVAVSFRDIAQNLVIGSVFLDDVDDMLKQAGISDALWNRPGSHFHGGEHGLEAEELNGRGELPRPAGR